MTDLVTLDFSVVIGPHGRTQRYYVDEVIMRHQAEVFIEDLRNGRILLKEFPTYQFSGGTITAIDLE